MGSGDGKEDVTDYTEGRVGHVNNKVWYIKSRE